MDGPRIAAIYNGLSGRGLFVPFRKGDPEGNRWVDNEPLFINWSTHSVDHLSSDKSARWQGCDYFFTDGIAWTRGANHVPIKAKWLDPGVMDVNAMKLRPISELILSTKSLLALMNSDIFSFFLKKFIAHTWMAQISDLRMMPVLIADKSQEAKLSRLAQTAIDCKRLTFSAGTLSNEQASFVRAVAQKLNGHAPSYLRPPAQQMLLVTAGDALAILELAVNWEAEKLYGVEGLGPFDEF
jgi:hypothetical protein